jgi:hypothetical protein
MAEWLVLLLFTSSKDMGRNKSLRTTGGDMTTRSVSIQLIDCGRLTRRTRGNYSGYLQEQGVPPFIWFPWHT